MNASREERREAARAKAEKLRQEQAAREKRSRNILIGALVGIVALVVVVGLVIFNESKKTLLDEFDGATPAYSNNHGGIIVGAEGAGKPNDGAKNVQVYLDFMCPYCGQFEDLNAADLAELREAGEINVTYHILANLDRLSMGTAFSTRSANAAVTVASDAPEYFVPFIEGMFANQPAENTEGLSDEEIATIALEAGVPQEVVDTFADGTYVEWTGVASQQAQRDGVPGTPAVFLDGKQIDQREVNYMEAGVLTSYLADQGVSGIGE